MNELPRIVVALTWGTVAAVGTAAILVSTGVRRLLACGRTPHEDLLVCALCEQDVSHEVFITSPPGWGSRMPCSAFTRQHGHVVVEGQEVGP